MLTDAWHEASRDLEVDVVAPYHLVDETTGADIECIAYLRDFGSPNGAVVLPRSPSPKDARIVAERVGIFWALIDEDSYATYDRDLFAGTLDDWGWFGDDNLRPLWCRGVGWPPPSHLRLPFRRPSNSRRRLREHKGAGSRRRSGN